MYNKDFLKLVIEKSKEIKNDIPVVALIEKNGEIISIQANKKEENNQTIAHAEILAINEANKKLGSWRLDDCNLYVNLEPCPMCAWAIISARIKNVFFSCYDTNYGAFGGKINLIELANSKLKAKGGLQDKSAQKVLDDYFKNLRCSTKSCSNSQEK